MKKKILFVFLLILTGTLTYFLNNQFKNIPPLGKLLNPYNGFWKNAESDKIIFLNNINLNNLNETITIQYDSMLVPHIYAKNDEDLFYAQGYLTAMHRLWQMEFQIKAASGQLSEIIGIGALNRDREQRRKGILYAAKRTLKKSKTDLETNKLLEAYVRGINEYIDNLNYSNYPIEYKLLDYKPEKWTLLKTFILMESMSDMLSSRDTDIEDTYLLNILGKEKYDQLFPEFDARIDPIIPKGTKFNFKSKTLEVPEIKKFNLLPKKTFTKAHQDNGSNNFAISPDKTKDGNVYVASQPDLSLNLPSIWYLIHLNSPTYNTMGASLPGAPGVIIGFNDYVAWGETNATRDVVDWYKINFRDNSRSEYRYGNKWLKTEKVIEEIKVKNSEVFYDTVIYTHYGPVSYDHNFNRDSLKTNFAMRWIAHDESVEYKTFLLLNKAKNIYDIEEALKYFHGPAQNFAYGTKYGDIGLTIAGKFPIKWEEQGKFVLDGSDPNHEWQDYIPYDHSLKITNPKRGFVSSANQHPSEKTYPYYYYSHNYEMYRGRRLNDRLESINFIELVDVMKIQNDNFSYKAYETLPVILNKIDSVSLSEKELKYYYQISDWDYFSNSDNTSAPIFNLWWSNIRKNLWEEFDTMTYSYRKPNSFTTSKILEEYDDFDFYDDITTKNIESINDIVSKSFIETVDSLDNWKERNKKSKILWKDFKNTRVRHLLGIESFSKNNIDIGGYRNTVNAASQGHGPSWRMIVKLSKDEETEAWGIYPGGQSGNPGSPNYFEGIYDWGKGNYKKLLFSKEPLTNNSKIIYEKKIIIE
tara:strand:- start:12706 stop:15135 length:2430 start_codon:yes stop_codon:yes gene_type:complete